MISFKTRAAVLGTGLAVTLAACSSSHHRPSAAASSTTVAPSSTVAPGTTTAPPPTSPVPTTAPATTSSTGPTGPVRCLTTDLVGSLSGENGAAGSVYYMLDLANRGSVTCVMQGYPGVSFVTTSSGQQVGAPADRTPGSTPSFLLGPGQMAQAVLQVTEASNYGSACQITPTDGLRVYPPDERDSLVIAHSDRACANTSDVTLHIGPMQPSS
ncbi:MAG: DUF4232 domain-containing protein [Actinomycetota bacterium]|nr:DUF4232 domain-containing protein [Actinomycetota bacterium]